MKELCPALSAVLLASSLARRARALARNQRSAQCTLLAAAELKG